MFIYELTSFEIRVNSLLERWKKYFETYKARGKDPDINDFNQWFSNTFKGAGKTLNPDLGTITSLNQANIKKYLTKALSYYNTGELWQGGKEIPAEQPTSATVSSAIPATSIEKQVPSTTTATPASGQEIELPGTNYKYKFTPAWVDAAGKPAPEAVANVLNQLAAGTPRSDIDFNALTQARRAVGLLEAKKSKRKILKGKYQ